jgi:hypothetical protein
MLTIHNKQLNSTFERIIRDKNGVLFRVRFVVVDVDGKLQPQIVSAEALIKNKETVVYLPEATAATSSVYTYIPSFVSKISPYFSLDFFMSQPTRAPSL